MEKIVQLKNTSNQNISPITVAEAVLKEDTSIVSSLLPEPVKPNSILVSNGNTSQWKPINAIFQGQLELLAYGVRIDPSIADPKLERIGNMDLHRSLPIQNKMRRCLLLDDGTVNYYLDPNNSLLKEDGTPAVLDGTDGQVMVEIPRFYYLGIPNGSCTDVYITEYPLEGFIESRKQYVSAYQATIDRENTSLASVCSMAERYRGGNNNVEWDGTYRTLLSRPASFVSLTNFRAYARKRGTAGMNGCGWNCYTYQANHAIYWLFVIEYATLNSQETFNSEVDSNGFKQGGLGEGVSTLNKNKWNVFNNSYPFVPCGITNELGNAIGVVTYQMPAEYDTSASTATVVEVPSYRGIENPFGHVFHWMDGVLATIQSNEEGGRSLLYVCDDPAKYSSTSVGDYSLVGDISRNSGYIKSLLLGKGLCNIPYYTGVSDNTYHCDYYWTNIPDTGTSLRGLLVGGNAGDRVNDGLTYTYTYYEPTRAGQSFGTRLCFVPEG